jgi:hypothetical protein
MITPGREYQYSWFPSKTLACWMVSPPKSSSQDLLILLFYRIPLDEPLFFSSFF